MLQKEKFVPPRNGTKKTQQLNQRRLALAGMVAAFSLLASGQSLAASEPNLNDLQAENARLRLELNQLKASATPDAATTAVPVAAAAAAPAKTTTAAVDKQVETLDQVVIHARDRSEKLQDVPIAVTAISAKTLEQTNSLTVQEFTHLAPNMFVQAGNARQQSIAIRGVGKNVSNDALMPSVGVVIDGVPTGYVTQAWGDFPDLDHVEILRGPQGTLQGQNTTLGVINIVSKAPSFTPQSTFELSLGQRNGVGGKASVTGPIQEGVLAFRASVFADKIDGPFKNIAPEHSNETLQETNKIGGKLQFLVLPNDNTTAKFTFERQESAEDLPWGEPPLLGDPSTFPNGSPRYVAATSTATTYTSRLARFGFSPLSSWNTVSSQGVAPTRSTSNGVTADISTALTGALDGFTLTSISAYRDSLFDAKNNSVWSPLSITTNGAVINQHQISEELRISSPVAKDRVVDYTAGIYLLKSKVDATDRTTYYGDSGTFYANNKQYADLNANPVGKLLMHDSTNGLAVYTKQTPDTTSYAAFSQLNWHFDDKTTLTLGLRRTTDIKSLSYNKYLASDSTLGTTPTANLSTVYAGNTATQLTDAQAIRTSQVGTLGYVPEYTVEKSSYSWLINPSYKVTDDILLYGSLAQGVKSGAVQTTTFNSATLAPYFVAPEKSLDWELGVKGAFLDHSVVWNTNIYETQLSNYQQQLSAYDAYQTSLKGGTPTNTSYLSNIPGVTLRGLETDGSWTPNRNWRFTFGASLSQAYYSSFANSPCNPNADGSANSGQCNYTGKTLPYESKFIENLGVSYHQPISGNLVLNTFVNDTFRSRSNLNASLSDFGWWGAYNIADAGISVATQDGKWDIGLLAKNLFDTKYVTDISPYSTSGAITATPGQRRYISVVLHSKQF